MRLTHTVPPESRRLRADKVLALAFPEHSRSLLQRAFAADLVRRNGRPVEKSDELPKKVQLRRPTATLRIDLSVALLSISRSPSSQ